MSEDGIVLFSRVFNPKVDDQLFGGLMSALNTFAESLSDGGLSNFELSDKRFALMKMNKLLFVANASLTVKDKKLREEIKKIAEKFFTKYSEDLIKEWNYDISVFYDFKKEIEDTLKNPMKKFWNGF
ncbi:MAG: hypothetical protein V3V33_11745 [Candidatus Lokiarchaeia archaeon]